MRANPSVFLAGGFVLFAGVIPFLIYSIGGADARTNSLGIVDSLGTETGLSRHLRLKEGDTSGTRCDIYLCNTPLIQGTCGPANYFAFMIFPA